MNITKKQDYILYHGDCMKYLKKIPDNSVQLIITSPPYNIGQEYEKKISLAEYLSFQKRVIRECDRILKPNGSICWQVGNYKDKGENIPLDILLYPIFKEFKLELRNRIIWHFEGGLGSNRRFYKRYETILWFVKSRHHIFNIDPLRLPRIYHQKKDKKTGKLKGNPLGKNPGDVWDIPLVNNFHIEKSSHPCQYPVGLVERLILALSNKGDIVVDPFIGSGTTAVASLLHKRKCIGIEKESKYIKTAQERLAKVFSGNYQYKSYLNPILFPNSQLNTKSIIQNDKL